MKSIMEQASSIIKAIEKAWISADKPKEFSVKVFEKEEKNFFGMTTKPAKIGIFFSDKSNALQEKNIQKPRPEIKEQRPEAPKPQRQAAPIARQQATDNKPIHHHAEKPKTVINPVKISQPQRVPTTWNDTMIKAVDEWINRTLTLMGMSTISFTPEIAGKILKLTFSQPLIEQPAMEKQLFRSIAHLIMASLRNQYKQEIKDLKIVLIRPE